VALHEADVAMKSGQDGRLKLERVLVGLLGNNTAERRQP
jgi:DNA polymerase-3 subunit delta